MKHKNITYHKVPRETFQKTVDLAYLYQDLLDNYITQLEWWNQRINLVSRNVPRETICNHIQHSLLLAQFDCFQQTEWVVDAGTGGGLPGIPLAITHPKKRFILNDIVTKKTLATKQMVQKLGLENVVISDGSVEKISLREPFLLVSKHAFKVDELWKMTRDKSWNQIVFYKGIDFEEEIQNSRIPDTFSLKVYSLGDHAPSSFYRGKALVILVR